MCFGVRHRLFFEDIDSADGVSQKERMIKLNEIAIHQMILLEDQKKNLYLK